MRVNALIVCTEEHLFTDATRKTCFPKNTLKNKRDMKHKGSINKQEHLMSLYLRQSLVGASYLRVKMKNWQKLASILGDVMATSDSVTPRKGHMAI